jgi:hypothetical protein
MTFNCRLGLRLQQAYMYSCGNVSRTSTFFCALKQNRHIISVICKAGYRSLLLFSVLCLDSGCIGCLSVSDIARSTSVNNGNGQLALTRSVATYGYSPASYDWPLYNGPKTWWWASQWFDIAICALPLKSLLTNIDWFENAERYGETPNATFYLLRMKEALTTIYVNFWEPVQYSIHVLLTKKQNSISNLASCILKKN